MFFSRAKQQDTTMQTGLTDGIEAQVSAFIADLKATQRSERDVLRLLTDADLAHFTGALQDEINRRETELADLSQRHFTEIALKDTAIQNADREITSLRDRVDGQDAEIRRRADERGALLAVVAKIDPNLDTSTMPNAADVRREVVRRKFGDAAVDGKPDAYVDARFDVLQSAITTTHPTDGVPVDRAAAEQAYRDMVRDLSRPQH